MSTNAYHSEYPKSWFHTIELAVGLETDTSEILNECIESVKNFGRVGVTGVYVGYTNHFNIGMFNLLTHTDHKTNSPSQAPSWSAASASSATAKRPSTCTGTSCWKRSKRKRSTL